MTSATGSSRSRRGAALAILYGGDPGGARRLVETARSSLYGPSDKLENSVLLGVVSYRQQDLKVAKQAFTATIDQADALLAMTPERYEALEAKAGA